jgi:hypothetical protein
MPVLLFGLQAEKWQPVAVYLNFSRKIRAITKKSFLWGKGQTSITQVFSPDAQKI